MSGLAETELRVETFDHHTAEHALHWREILKEARATCPIVHSPTNGGFFVLTKHADVTAALRDHKRFSSERSWDEDGNDLMRGVAIQPQPIRVGFLEMDPPESLKYRRLMNRWFTRGAVDRGRGRIIEAANWAVDRVIARGECDVIDDLASPFQCMVFLDLLGIPLDRGAKYKEIADRLTAQQPDATTGIEWMRADLKQEFVAQKARGTGVGLIADLATAEVDGAPIDDDMATELLLMLLLGGEGTTISTIANLLVHLSQHPDDRKRLAADMSLMPGAVDEMLRYYAPSPGLARTVTEEATIGGHTFQPGDRVLLSFASANYDEDVFPDGDHVDITRAPNPHLSFGAGAHRCIGSLLARANAEIFLETVLTRIPDFEIDEAKIRRYTHAALSNGFFSVPMKFTPQPTADDVPEYPTLTAPRIQPELIAE
jgi:cytochrome P450